MNHSEICRQALYFIESHLDQPITVEGLSARFHYSPFYFHRLFSAVAGKTLAAYVRDRRLQKAALLLSGGGESLLTIGLECGYPSAQSFSRAFRAAFGISPSAYRAQGTTPHVESLEAITHRFVNRLKGGMQLHPHIIRKEKLRIAGLCGDGNETGRAWEAFERALGETGLPQKLSEDSYEVRLYGPEDCKVHVGFAVQAGPVPAPFTLLELPASTYASFDVFVSRGYESENDAMDEWLKSNPEGYRERPWAEDTTYVVEHYDQRFRGKEAGSIVEIWVPVEKKG